MRRLLADAGIRAVVDSRRTRPGVRFGAADRCGAALRIEVRGWGGPGTLRQFGSAASCTVTHQASWPSARAAPCSSLPPAPPPPPSHPQIGARDVAAHTCTLVPRRASDATEPPTRLAGVSTEGGEVLAAAVTDLLDDAQRELRWGAEAVVQEAIVDVGSFLELRVSRSGWCVSASCSSTLARLPVCLGLEFSHAHHNSVAWRQHSSPLHDCSLTTPQPTLFRAAGGGRGGQVGPRPLGGQPRGRAGHPGGEEREEPGCARDPTACRHWDPTACGHSTCAGQNCNPFSIVLIAHSCGLGAQDVKPLFRPHPLHRRRRARACGASPWPSPPAWPTASPPASTRATRPPRQPSLRARCEALLNSAAGNQHSCLTALCGSHSPTRTQKHSLSVAVTLRAPHPVPALRHAQRCILTCTSHTPLYHQCNPSPPPNHQPTKRNDDRIPSEHCLSLLMRTVRVCVQIAAFAVSPCFAMFPFCE